MAGRFLDRILARFGYGLVSLRAQDQERRAGALAVEALEDRLDAAERRGADLEGQILQLNAGHEKAQQQLWDRFSALRGSLGASRRELKSMVARVAESETQLAAEAASRAEVEARLWAKLTVMRTALDGARASARRVQEQLAEQARGFAERSAAEAQANTEVQNGLWGRLELERRRRVAAGEAAAEAGIRAGELKRELKTSTGQLASIAGKLETEAAKRVAAQRALAKVQRKLASVLVAQEKSSAQLRAKLTVEAANKTGLKAKVREQASRTDIVVAENSRLRAEIAELSTRLAALEAAQTRVAADEVLGERGPFSAKRSDIAADRAVDALIKANGGKPNKPGMDAAYFNLGRALQVQGATELAAAAYRRLGPKIGEHLAQPGPDGRPVSGPDFFIIGAPRAATTWLKQALSHHPDVLMFAGEPQFFSMTASLGPDYYVSRFSESGARFLKRFRKERTIERPASPIYGEKSTTYLSMSEAQISLLAALYPNARIVCLVREPVARAWSHIKHDGLAEVAESLKALINQPYWTSLDAQIRHGRYAYHLARWGRRYPPEQIHLVDFARLGADPDGVYREVLAHIGASVDAKTRAPERVNQSGDAKMPAGLRDMLEKAYANDRFDLPWLRDVMERAWTDRSLTPTWLARSSAGQEAVAKRR